MPMNEPNPRATISLTNATLRELDSAMDGLRITALQVEAVQELIRQRLYARRWLKTLRLRARQQGTQTWRGLPRFKPAQERTLLAVGSAELKRRYNRWTAQANAI